MNTLSVQRRKVKKKLFELLVNKVTLFILLTVACCTFLIMLSTYVFPSFFGPSLLSPVPAGITNITVSTNSKESKNVSSLSKILRSSKISYGTISADDISFVVRLSKGEEVIFSKSKDLKEQVASLQLIISRLTIEGKTFKKLDFRYDRAVIVL